MSLAQLRRASQLTLPSDVKKYLHLNEGDYLEFAYDQGRVILAPVSVQRKDVAWNNLFTTLNNRTANAISVEEMNTDIAEGLKAIRA